MFKNPILENLYMQQCKDDMSITPMRNVVKVKIEEKRYPREIITDMIPLLHDIFDSIGKWEIVGSYRRDKADFKDIDIIVMANKEQFAKLHETIIGINIMGDNIIRGKINGYDIDINRCDAENYEPMKLFRTGSMQHNIKMRGKAKNMGMKLNEHGLFRGNTLIANESEKTIFDMLGMDYLKPNERGD